MTASRIEMNVDQAREGAATVRTLDLDIPGKGRFSIFFRCEDEALPEPRLLDGFVLGVLLAAMESGMDILVRGALSPRLLRNMEEYQGAWHCWEPHRYKIIEIIPDHVAEPVFEKDARGSILAFSGGIDSTFTAWRQRPPASDPGKFGVRDALIFHGFDIGLRNTDHFTLLVDRLRKFLEALGIRLRVIRTNLKETGLLDWEHSFSAQMAACLHQYSHEFRHALLAGSEPYNALILPGGSNPIIDPMLSGDDMTLVHYGAGFTRPEKLEVLVREGVPLKDLKVCWEGKRQDKNCGRCEKCIRTHLSFLLAGVAHAPCFEEPLRMNDLRSLVLMNHVQHAQLSAVYRDAQARGQDNEEWAVTLKKLLDRFHPPNSAETLVLKIRRRLRRIVIGY